MSEPFVFDPCRSEYKTPFGAVPCGETVTFTCRPLAAEGFTHCSVGLYHEFSALWQEKEMTLSGRDGDRVCFTVFADKAEGEIKAKFTAKDRTAFGDRLMLTIKRK